MASISSFTLKLIVDESVVFQSFSGFAACGLFYNLIKSVDENLAEELHSSKKLASWSATPFFMELPQFNRVVYRSLTAPSIVKVSFTIIDDKLTEVFKEAILKPELRIEIVNAKARIFNISFNTRKFSDIAYNANPLPEKFMIKFLTPTAFRHSIYDCCPTCPCYIEYLLNVRGGKLSKPCDYAVLCRGLTVPLPLPSLMFRNMARIWSTFSDTRLELWETVKWVETAMLIAGYPTPGIKTIRVYEHPTTNKWIVGFIGAVRFAIREDVYKEKYAKAAAALLKMGELTNIGIRRTAGLGMIKYEEPLRKEEDKNIKNKI
ncbi:MAG: CRISPR system precrRNA processing endoribonuclease RAMP protein Cas6 [Candidatus Bathyarchaeia archaeon]